MLTLVTRVSRDGQTETGSMVLNTDYMSKLRVYNTTQCRFKFNYKPEDRRGGHYIYVVSETQATLLTQANKTYNAIGINLDVYPDNDATKATVATVFNVKEIIRAYPNTVADKTKCWIEVNEKGFKARKYLVAHYYVNIAALAETGTTTTTSTSTS